MKKTLPKCTSLAWQHLTHVALCNIVCIKLLAGGFGFSALREVTEFGLNPLATRECQDAFPNKKCQCLLL